MYEKYINLTKTIEYTCNTVFEEIYYFEDEDDEYADGVIYLSGDNKEVKKKFNLDDSINNIYDITKAILDKGKTVFCLMGTITDFCGVRFSIKSPELDKIYKITSNETLLEQGGFGVYISQHDGKYVCRYGLFTSQLESPNNAETFKPITQNYEKDIIGKDVIKALDSLDMYFWDIVPTIEEAEEIINKTKHAKINIDNTILATERSGWMESDYFVLLADGTYLIDAIESEDEDEYIDESEFIENNLEEGIYIALAYACPENGSTSDIEGENGTGIITWKDNKEYSLPEDCILGHMEDDYGILVVKKDDEFEITFSINESFRYGPGFGYRKISSIEDKLEEPLHRALIKIMYDAIIFEVNHSYVLDIFDRMLRKLLENSNGSDEGDSDSIIKEFLDEELKGKSEIESKMIMDLLDECFNESKRILEDLKDNSNSKNGDD